MLLTNRSWRYQDLIEATTDIGLHWHWLAPVVTLGDGL